MDQQRGRLSPTDFLLRASPGATDGGIFRRPGSTFLRAHRTKLLDLCVLPWSTLQYRHFHVMAVTRTVMRLFLDVNDRFSPSEAGLHRAFSLRRVSRSSARCSRGATFRPRRGEVRRPSLPWS